MSDLSGAILEFLPQSPVTALALGICVLGTLISLVRLWIWGYGRTALMLMLFSAGAAGFMVGGWTLPLPAPQ